MANGKKKGNKGEREVANWFKKWTGYDFTRIPASGGLRWKNVKDTVGDIICTDDKHSGRFPFSVESKKYKEIEILPCIIGQKANTLTFWEQAKDDGDRGGKEPILFMRYNNMKRNTYFVVVNEDIGKWILKHLNHKIDNYIMKLTSNEQKFYLMSSELLMKVDYKEIYKFIRKKLKG